MLQADAMKTCNNWGAQLATIYGFEENLNIAQIVMATNVTRYWVDSSNLEDPRYGYWDINEPDSTRGTCAYIDLVQSSQYKAGLSYASCNDSMSAVCEMYACLSGYFRCANNNCINRQWTCDGTNDCGDNSDETDCSSLCRSLITGQTSGQIRSASPYAANSDCQWVIEAPVGTRISLQFTAFATEFMLDEVQVWMGGKTLLTSTLLKRLSGSPTTSAFQFWPTLYSSNNYMIIVFRSDATNQLAGFTATWTAVTSLPGAGSTLQATTTMQTFTSPSYPAGLLPGLSETWIIRSRKWSVVQIKINSMMLCPGSTVMIFNGDNVYSQILATINPGNPVSGTYIVATTNAMMIQLKTQMWCQSTGFSIGYMEGCGGTLVMNNGYVASPGYGFGDYANFTVCQWKVQTPAGSFIKVHFDSLFNLDSRGDRLKLYDGSTNSSNLVYDVTGTVAPQDFTSSNNTLFFIFTSNAIVSNAGFRAGFSIGCPDPMFNVNTQFTPNPYTLTLGSQIVVTCPVGYFLAEQPFLGMASVTLMCGVNGWNYFRSPQCHKVYCGEPPILDNGFIISSTGVEYQAQVTYGCYGGYNLGSVFSVTCQQDATWTTAPFCTPVQCPQQQLSIANGAVLIAGGDGVSFTSVLNYTCDTGYQINGTPLLVCQQDGTWSASPPTCIPRTCPVPLIANAAVVPFDFVTVTQQAIVSCNSGFALADTGLQFAAITCLGTLQFDSIPSCIDINECTNSNGGCQSLCINTPGSYSCQCAPGYQPSAADVTVCVDIDECATGVSYCGQTCTNSPGSYTCSCDMGYVLYTANGMSGYNIPPSETGTHPGDTYYLNHTCVAVSCPPLTLPVNGNLMSTRRNFRVNETVYFLCSLGFTPVGNTSLTCQQDGTWTSAPPTCITATCPLPSTAGVAFPPISFTPSTSTFAYQSTVTLTCSTNLPSPVTLTRTCNYNKRTNSYDITQSGSISCPVVNCGPLELGSGYLYTPLTSSQTTYYGAKYQLSCDNLFYMAGSSTSTVDPTYIECAASGQWTYGNITCVGVPCSDPGTPPGGFQWPELDYEVNKLVRFNCSRPGYFPNNMNPLMCMVSTSGTNVVWNSTIPSCVDMVRPVFASCPNSTVLVPTMQTPFSVGLTFPRVTDNSGATESSLGIRVTPPTFLPTQVINGSSVAVTYTVTDFNNNVATCSFLVRTKNPVPPTIKCPNSTTAYLPTPNQTMFVYTVSQATASSNFSAVSITYNPPNIIADASMLGQFVVVTATATDTDGVTASCRFSVAIQAAPCSPWAIKTPPNTNMVCTPRPAPLTGYRCVVTCKSSAYKTQSGGPSYVSTCSTGGNWSQPFLGCITPVKAKFVIREETNYTYTSSSLIQPITWNNNCSSLYDSQFKFAMTNVSTSLSAICSQAANTFVDVSIDLNSVMLFNDDPTLVTVFYDVYILPDNLTDVATSICGQIVSILFLAQGGQVSAMTYLYGGMSCADIYAPQGKGAAIKGSYTCPPGQQLSLSQDNNVCTACAPGTYADGLGNCIACPVGTYSDQQGLSACLPCPAGTYTYTTGAYNSSQCMQDCSSQRMVSATRMAPCFECPINTYATNSTTCVTCPAGTSTVTTGRWLLAQCLTQCAPGSFSQSGFWPSPTQSCSVCPVGYYQPNAQQKTCFECPLTTDFTLVGATSASDCKDGPTNLCANQPCVNGGTCTVSNHAFFCTCNPGYTGATCDVAIDWCEASPCFNGGTCTPVLGGSTAFTCRCPSGYGGSRCEIMPNACLGNTCQNGGQCQNLGTSYRCLCPLGFSDTFCQTVQSICVRSACQNGGTCVVLSSQRRQCTCPPGYSGQSCETNINECASNPCLFGGTCIDGVNMFTCSCVAGYTGVTCQTRPSPLCASTVCGSTGSCVDDYITPQQVCLCNAGYSSTNVGRNGTWWQSALSVSGGQCAVTNYCASNPCVNSGTCSSGALGYTCACPTGYGGLRCQEYLLTCTFQTCYNGGTCSGNPYTCTCAPGFGGRNCENVGNMCSPAPCVAGQYTSCTTLPSGMFQCNCKLGYTGTLCETQINNCLRNPCLHGGTCTNLVGAFTCSCVAGWTGPTCDSILDLCETNPCQNGATCFTLFNDYLCKCITPFFGKNCDSSQDLCLNTKPCVGPNSVCTQQASQTTCQCAPGYTGDGCEIAIDFCNRMNPICANGAICSPLWENYTCTCPTDYVDQRCAYSPNYCTPSTCTAPGVCVSGYQGAYCDCPIGLTGSACTKAVDLNYDLYFYISNSAPVAMQPYLFKLGGNGFSVGIWLRFDSMSTSGTFFSLFGARYRAINTDIFPLLTVAADHAIVSFGGSIVNLSFNPFQIYNHRWYFLSITWSTATSQVDFRINGVRIANLANYGFGYTLPPFGYIVLGSEFDTVAKVGVPDTGFAGWLSQVNMWNRSLTLNEILSLSLQASASGTLNSGKVVQWQNYLLGLGVKVVRPSTAGQSVCRDPMMTGYPACTTPLPDRVAPSILCPSNIITTSSTRLTQVTWPAPNVTGTNLAPTSIFSNGNVFIWGRYTNTYVAADTAGNVALCDFDIFVQVDQCPDVSASVNNAPVCDGYGDNFKTCTPGCNSGTALPRPSPDFYTCGPEGKFNGFNYFLPFQTPSCGAVQPGSMTLQINITYLASQYCDGQTSITAFDINIIKRCDAKWDALWGTAPGTTKGFSKGAGCATLLANQITETCIMPGGNIAGGIMAGRKKRQATLAPFVTITIPNLPMLLYSSSGQYPSLTPYEIILADILDAQGLDFGTSGDIPYAYPVQDSISLAIVAVCNVGQTSIDGTCVSCPPGTFYNATSLTCDYCPIGTYQDQSQQTSCVPCTSGTTTALVGMTSSSNCYTICPAGSQITSPDPSGTCKLCDIGFHQNLTGQAFCWPCAADQTTANTGSTSSSVCFAVCPSGTQLAAVGGTCQNCSIGYYRTLGLQDSCVQCPTGWVTPTVRSVSIVACTVRNCTAGTYIDTTQTPYGCTPCPIGQYQPMDYQYSCNQCPASQSTANTGSKSLSSCQYYCPIGQEAANPLQPSVCTNCSIGYYKDNTVPGARCTVCDDPTYITASTGSTSLADCTVYNCSAGSHLDTVNGGGCLLCETDSYQPKKWQTSCIQCPPQTSTGILGATSLSQCTVYCSAGYESVNQVCAPCKIGYYKNAGGPGPCDQCFTDYITPTNASTDISQCTVANSPPGSYRVTNTFPETIAPCDYNFYQPNYAQLSCLQCPTDSLSQPLVTLTMNTSASSGCVTNCPSGQQYNTATGSCVDCPRGYFRTQNNNPYEPVCVMCDPLYITPDVRSFTQDQCTVGNCTAGQKINEASCVECPIGQYQPNKWQTSCIPCPTGQTTLTMSSTSASQCLFSCTGANACLNGGTCYQANNTGEPTCSCTPAYTGTHCETGIFDWLPVIIGVSVGGSILLLLLTLLLCLLCRRRRRKEKTPPIVVAPPTGPAAGYLTTTTGFGEKTPNVINSVAANTVTRANPSLAVFGNTHSSANSYAFYEDSDDIPVLAGMKDVTSMRYNNVQSTAYNNRAYEVADGFESKAQSMNFT